MQHTQLPLTRRRREVRQAALAIVFGLAAAAASAQPYAISWSTVDGGGAMRFQSSV